jgi:flagellar basal-body rod protein FlgG
LLKEFFTAALGMVNQQTRLEVISNNIANASTNGYKRADVFTRNLIDARANFYNVPGEVEQNDPPVGSYYDFSKGSFQQTGNPLDLAVDGNGFFLLEDSEGKQFLSRNGEFRLSEDGTIIRNDSKVLMGDEGPIRVSNTYLSNSGLTKDGQSPNLRIADTGEVYLNNVQVGKISLYQPQNLQDLQRISDGEFILTANGQANQIASDAVKIKQGWLENSNVNVVSEMVQMIELQRNFEAGSKVIQTNDQTLDQSINLGRYY